MAQDARLDFDEALTIYWINNYAAQGSCVLCGNSGIVDTTATATDQLNRPCGQRTYCLCPNGQMLRKVRANA